MALPLDWYNLRMIDTSRALDTRPGRYNIKCYDWSSISVLTLPLLPVGDGERLNSDFRVPLQRIRRPAMLPIYIYSVLVVDQCDTTLIVRGVAPRLTCSGVWLIGMHDVICLPLCGSGWWLVEWQGGRLERQTHTCTVEDSPALHSHFPRVKESPN